MHGHIQPEEPNPVVVVPLLDRGVPIMVEKPLTASVAEAETQLGQPKRTEWTPCGTWRLGPLTFT